jgi:hypothetical protein
MTGARIVAILIAIAIATVANVSCGSKTSKSQSEQMFSGLPPKADALP